MSDQRNIDKTTALHKKKKKQTNKKKKKKKLHHKTNVEDNTLGFHRFFTSHVAKLPCRVQPQSKQSLKICD